MTTRPMTARCGDGADELLRDGRAADGLRAEFAAWLDQHLTAEVREVAAESGVINEDNMAVLREWNRTLADAGWAAPAWPEEYGGRAATVPEQLAWLEVMSAAGAPGAVNVIGVSNIAPAIMAVGTDEQRRRYLRPMLRGDEIWCQGMSEPDAGSDLASLRTSARQDGETFVVNGQKTWNSLGAYADWCQLYVRTDPDAPKHKGISCLLVDMRSPGVEVRPLRTMAGDRTFSELFFTDVVVPRANLLGNLERGLAGGHHHVEPRAGRRGPAAPGPAGAAQPADGRCPGPPGDAGPGGPGPSDGHLRPDRRHALDDHPRAACHRGRPPALPHHGIDRQADVVAHRAVPGRAGRRPPRS